MKVAILCGGKGERLREETEFKPKPLIEVGDMPILWHIMKTYAHYGHKEFVLLLGYKGSLIKRFFLDFEGSLASGILEYGVVTLVGGGIAETATRLCRGTGRIRAADTAVHGLGERDVAGFKDDGVGDDDTRLACEKRIRNRLFRGSQNE